MGTCCCWHESCHQLHHRVVWLGEVVIQHGCGRNEGSAFWALEMGPRREREEGKANVLTLGAKGLNPPVSLILV